MKRYDVYKDSGVQWIGQMPSHWDVGRLKFTGRFENGLTYSPNDISDDSGILVLRSSNIQAYKLNFNDCVYVSNTPKELVVKNGDIIICSRNGSPNLIGKCIYIDCNITATYGAFMMRYRPIIHNKYAFYLFQTAVSYYKGLFITTTINQLTKGIINQMTVPIVPLPEQQAMASYLDKRCGEIDRAIAKQQKRIELLQELRQSIIINAVTRGINPDAPLKDSGVEWIGQVPEHWEVMKTSLIYNNIGSGTTPSSSNPSFYTEDSDGFFWLQTGDLNDGMISNTSKKVTKLAVNECKLKFYPVNSVVIAMYGATIGKVGLLKIETATNQACCVLPKSKKMNELFSFYLYQAAKQPMILEAMGGGQPNISQDIIKKLKIPVPPIFEQHQIVDHIEKQTARLDKSIAKAEHRIELLQELKQSIITEVVTGKRKVC